MGMFSVSCCANDFQQHPAESGKQHRTFHSELGRAGDLAAGGGRNAGVETGVLGSHVLEHQRQGVLVVLREGKPWFSVYGLSS